MSGYANVPRRWKLTRWEHPGSLNRVADVGQRTESACLLPSALGIPLATIRVFFTVSKQFLLGGHC